MKITYGLVCGAENLIKAIPFMETFATACGSAKNVFKIIDRQPKIDSMSQDGIKLDKEIEETIEFKEVTFSYPARPDVPVSFYDFNCQTLVSHLNCLS